jgi:hypothetical protein
MMICITYDHLTTHVNANYIVFTLWVDLVYRSSLGVVDFGREMIVG